MFARFSNHVAQGISSIGCSRLVACLTFAIATSVASGSVFAQGGYLAPRRAEGNLYQPTPTLPVESGFSYHHASTAYEGAGRAWAEMTQANANYRLSVAQAEILNQQARGLAIQNRAEWIEYRTSLKAWREAERQRRTEELRAKNLAKRQAREEASQRLSLN